jgi:hypothetical protein
VLPHTRSTKSLPAIVMGVVTLIGIKANVINVFFFFFSSVKFCNNDVNHSKALIKDCN